MCNNKPSENLQSHQDLLKAPRSSGVSLTQGDSVQHYLVVTSQSTDRQLFIASSLWLQGVCPLVGMNCRQLPDLLPALNDWEIKLN